MVLRAPFSDVRNVMANFTNAMKTSVGITGQEDPQLRQAALRIERANVGSNAMINVDRNNQRVMYDLAIRSVESAMMAVKDNITRQTQALKLLKDAWIEDNRLILSNTSRTRSTGDGKGP